MSTQTYGVLRLFCGIGGAAIGMQEAEEQYRGARGNFITLAGIDCDTEACADFEALTGAPAVQMDLFSREDYIAFHGHEPPDTWREAVPEDLRQATGGIAPDVIFTSPPCKGFSGLLPTKSAKSEKYQALNRLTVRGLKLALEAYADDLPGLILLENVPRITTRGAGLLDEIKALLGDYGYLFHEGTHDCGEIGGLGQRRKRYLLIARNPAKVSAFVYRPPELRVRSIGEIIGPLPMPDDQAGGIMHRLPRLQWKTWVRLALIPAGGDWRDLEEIAPEQYRLEHIPRSGTFGVQEWDGAGGTVTAADGPNNAAVSVADPRLGHEPREGVYKVQRFSEPSTTVVGSAKVGTSNGATCVADPRLTERDNRHPGVYRVVRFDEPGPCVTGTRFGSGAPAVADPRIPADTEQGTWVIIALDDTWHRPLTTWELMALQGFPLYMPDGNPVVLAGKSDARWRERIGNAVPPPAAEAIGRQMLRALLMSAVDGFELSLTPIWVREVEIVGLGDKRR